MKPGTKVLCIDAKERGIPIHEGETYTVKRWGTYRSVMGAPPEIPRGNVKAVLLEEVQGVFMETRFRALD